MDGIKFISDLGILIGLWGEDFSDSPKRDSPILFYILCFREGFSAGLGSDFEALDSGLLIWATS